MTSLLIETAKMRRPHTILIRSPKMFVRNSLGGFGRIRTIEYFRKRLVSKSVL